MNNKISIIKKKSLLRNLFNDICFIKKNIKITDINEPIKQTRIIYGRDYNYIPTNCLNEINNTIKFIYNWRFLINGREYNLYIGLINDNNKYAKQSALMIYMWLIFIDKYADCNCSKKMDIYIYMTNLKKVLPENSTQIISPENVNSAFTTSCKTSTEIHLYREEEWFKVLIHETFHNLGLDFSNMNVGNFTNKILGRFFCIKTDFLLYEAYTETLAELISTMFNTAPNWTDFQKQIIKEQNFSVLQSCKILKFMDISYRQLSCNTGDNNVRKKYRENTAVFSYYVIKSILIVYIEEFMNWCENNNENTLQFNKTQNAIISFCDFIKEYYLGEKYLKIVDISEKKIIKNMSLSLRMTKG